MGHAKIFSVPAFFILVNAAALRAVWNVVRGRRIERWQPVRGSTADGAQRLAPSGLPTPGKDAP
jgi:hypothetical protein